MTEVLIWTRSLEHWPSDEVLIKQFASREVLHIPCITTKPRRPELSGKVCDYLIFTSAHAVSYGLAHPGIAAFARQARMVFTHGQKTAETLREAGIETRLIANVRTAAELCEWILANIAKPAHFGLPSAAEPAFALKEALQRGGFSAEQWVCYGTDSEATDRFGRPFAAELVQCLIRDLSGAIAFASPSAVNGFSKIFEPAKNRLGNTLRAVAIGPTTQAAAQEHFSRVDLASANSLQDLLRAAQTVWAQSS